MMRGLEGRLALSISDMDRARQAALSDYKVCAKSAGANKRHTLRNREERCQRMQLLDKILRIIICLILYYNFSLKFKDVRNK